MSQDLSSSPGAFTYRHRLKLSQTDAGGVVFFAQSLVIAHDAWEAVLDAVGFPVSRILKERQFALPIVEANTQLLRPMKVGDDVDVTVDLEKLGTSSVIARFQLAVAGQLVGRCRTVHVCIDGQGKSAPLPSPLREALASRLQVGTGDVDVTPARG